MLQDIPDSALEHLVKLHLNNLELKTLRLVSKEWKSLIDTTITALNSRGLIESQVMPHRPATPEVFVLPALISPHSVHQILCIQCMALRETTLDSP